MTNRQIKDILVADLFCLRATSEPEMMLFCDNDCQSCKWNYQKGRVSERNEMLKKLIELIDREYIKEITKTSTNRDKFNKMSNEEIANIFGVFSGPNCNGCICQFVCNKDKCHCCQDALLKWLDQEVEE